MHTRTMPIPVQQAATGPDFLVYPAKDGTVYLEALRPNGVRDGRSIFQFDPEALVSAVRTAQAMTQPIQVIRPPLAA